MVDDDTTRRRVLVSINWFDKKLHCATLARLMQAGELRSLQLFQRFSRHIGVQRDS